MEALIPRKLLFGNPDRTSVQISPDGNHLSWLAPVNGVLNIWVAPREDLGSARSITSDRGRGVRIYSWAHTGRHVLYQQDTNGDENFRLYSVDLQSGATTDLTPFDGVLVKLMGVSYKRPNEVVVGLNNRDAKWHDVYRLDITTGELTLLLQHDRYSNVEVDDEYSLRSASVSTADGGSETYVPVGGEWTLFDTVPPEDTMGTHRIGFDKTNRLIYMLDSRGRNTSALLEIDEATKVSRELASDPRVDIGGVMCHPTEKNIEAVATTYERTTWRIIDASIEPDFDTLRTVADGDFAVDARSLDDRYWVVRYTLDDAVGQYYLYDRKSRVANYLFSSRTALEDKPFAKMRPVVIKSSDGLDLVSYYTLPLGCDSDNDGVPDKPLPLVLIPHGGPWGRDYWGFNPYHQWFANRGFAVLAVNFRASTGFGKAFVNAGDRQWGGKIIDDQVDAVQWAIRSGIADAARVAVYGGSFGGYSALAGLTFHPKLFACGVDLVGPSSLVTLLESVPEYWKPALDVLIARVGDHRTKEGRELLNRHSPLNYVDRICRPLLIGQGANDPRVKRAESDQVVDAMKAKGLPVTYLLYSDEGHGFARPENSLSFNAVAEKFLAQHLGGRCEPVGDDFEGSSIQVIAGDSLRREPTIVLG